MVTPVTVYDYHPGERRLEVLKVQEIPSGYDASHYRTERLMVAARDGKQVPVSVVYPKGFEKDGDGQAVPLCLWRLRLRHPAGFSTPTASACSTAAGPSPSPTSAAATTWAINGSSTASSTKRDQRVQRFRRRREGAGRGGLHEAGPDRDQRRLGRRRADGRGRPTRTPSCGARSSPTCRSSTCSTPCSTTRCR